MSTSPNQPGLAPPPGVTPDFESPFSLQPYQAVVVAACIILTTVLVGARLYTKARIVRAVVWEDCKDPHRCNRPTRMVSLLTIIRLLSPRMGEKTRGLLACSDIDIVSGGLHGLSGDPILPRQAWRRISSVECPV